MKKTSKRILSALLSGAMLLSLLPVTAMAEEGADEAETTAAAASANIVYQLTDTLEADSSYLIVNTNEAGEAYALDVATEDGSTYTAVASAVTVENKSGTMTIATAPETAVWTAGAVDGAECLTLTNGTVYMEATGKTGAAYSFVTSPKSGKGWTYGTTSVTDDAGTTTDTENTFSFNGSKTMYQTFTAAVEATDTTEATAAAFGCTASASGADSLYIYKAVEASADTYTLVTDPDEISSDDAYVIVSEGYALCYDGSEFSAVAVTVEDDHLVGDVDAGCVWSVNESSESFTAYGAYTFSNEFGYLVRNNGAKALPTISETEDSNTAWNYDGSFVTNISGNGDGFCLFYSEGTGFCNDMASTCETNTYLYAKSAAGGECAHESSTYVEAVDPTCTEAGNIGYYQCDSCGRKFADEACTERLSSVKVDALGHDWGADYVTLEPTCTVKGIQHWTCVRCGETQETKIKATGHTYGEDGICTVCGAVKPNVQYSLVTDSSQLIAGERYLIVSGDYALTNDEGTFGAEDVIVTGDGYVISDVNDLTMLWTLGDADSSYSSAGTLTFVNDETYIARKSGGGSAAAQAATAESKYTAWGYDAENGYVLQTGGSGSASGYYLTYSESGAAFNTVTSASNCYLYIEEIKCDHEHVVHIDAQDATCTATGIKECWQCQDCGKYFTDETCSTRLISVIVPMLEHPYDEGTVITAPGCITPGETIYKCTACGYEKTVKVPAHGHDFGEDGFCTICGTEKGLGVAIYTSSDRHEESEKLNGVLQAAFIGTDTNITAAVLNGDNVNDTNTYVLSDVFDEVYSVLGDLSATTWSTWGNHDSNCDSTGTNGFLAHSDDAHPDATVFVDMGEYYIYGVDYTQMMNVDTAATGAAAFTAWINGETDIDGDGENEAPDLKPILMFSHVPLHTYRNDNVGASIWTAAINEAAETYDIVFIWGHNHTVDQTNYYYEVGDEMTAQGDSDPTVLNFTYYNAGYIRANTSASVLTVYCDSIRVQRFTADGLLETHYIALKNNTHVFGDAEWTWTETEDGYTASAAFACTKKDTTKTVDANVTVETTASTCTEAGSDVYTATVEFEGSTYTDTKTVAIDALGHTPAEAVTENSVAATCTAEGSYDTVVYCSVCNAELSRETTTVPATGHTPAEAITENSIDPACTAEGSYDTVVYCSVCNAELSRKTTTVPATGHTVVVDPAVAPTMTSTGLTEGSHCSVCGTVIVAQEVIPDTFKYVDDNGADEWAWATSYIYSVRTKGIMVGELSGTDSYYFHAGAALTRAEAAVIMLAVKGVAVDKTAENIFTDVDNDAWYVHYVATAAANGLTSGNGDGTFAPEANITRAEFVTMLLAAMGVKVDTEVDKSGFPDADGEWYTPYVAAAKEQGLTNGDDKGNFNPNADIIRAEVATMVDAVKVAEEPAEQPADKPEQQPEQQDPAQDPAQGGEQPTDPAQGGEQPTDPAQGGEGEATADEPPANTMTVNGSYDKVVYASDNSAASGSDCPRTGVIFTVASGAAVTVEGGTAAQNDDGTWTVTPNPGPDAVTVTIK